MFPTKKNKALLLQVDGEWVPLYLEFKRRKRLVATVLPDRSVTVSAPHRLSRRRVMESVERWKPWIASQRAYYATLPPPPAPPRFTEGETHPYLGKPHRLRILHRNGGRRGRVRRTGREIRIETNRGADPEKVRALLEKWYKERARRLFARRIREGLFRMRELGLPEPRLSVRKMKTQWGSCREDGGVSLNMELIKTPLPCIEYIVYHELCHLREQNHGRRFYALLSRYLPDWRARKERLDAISLPG